MKQYVKDDPNYRSMAEFLREAVREKMSQKDFYQKLSEALVKNEQNIPLPENWPPRRLNKSAIDNRLDKIEKTLESILKKLNNNNNENNKGPGLF